MSGWASSLVVMLCDGCDVVAVSRQSSNDADSAAGEGMATDGGRGETQPCHTED